MVKKYIFLLLIVFIKLFIQTSTILHFVLNNNERFCSYFNVRIIIQIIITLNKDLNYLSLLQIKYKVFIKYLYIIFFIIH